MCDHDSTRRGGVSLNAATRAAPALTTAFRGTTIYGEEAARRASSVSGPFTTTPTAFVIPRGEDDLFELVRWAWEEGVPLVPRAGGTGMPGGNLGPYVVVELSDALAGVQWLDEPAGRIRVRAGTVGGDVATEAGEHGLSLPFLPSSAPWCRFGGMIANNAAGARSFLYGAIASRVEAVEGCFAWGEPFRVGSECATPPIFETVHSRLRADWPVGSGPPADWPRVRKNSSGYALDRYLATDDPAQLLVGSEGTLAFITAVDLSLPRLPAAHGLAVAPVSSSRELTDLAVAAGDSPATTCEFLGRRFIEIARLASDPELGRIARQAYALVLLEVAGTTDEVDRDLEALSAKLPSGTVTSSDPRTVRRLWDLRHAASPTIAREADRGRISTQFIEDCVVPPESLGRYLDGLDEILRSVGLDAIVFGHAGDGNVHVNPLVDVTVQNWRSRVRVALDQVTDLVADLGGTLTGEHGDGRLRAPLIQRIWSPPIVQSFRTIKDTLDPQGILNPGVVLPLPNQDPLDGLTPRARVHPG